jgi:hypothetical protein
MPVSKRCPAIREDGEPCGLGEGHTVPHMWHRLGFAPRPERN